MSNKIYIGQDLLIDPSVSYTKAETDQKISDLVDLAPGALDTLNELAAALGDDANFATTVTDSIAVNANNISTLFDTTYDLTAVTENLGVAIMENEGGLIVNATAIANETARATAAEGVNATAIALNTAKVGITPAQASDISTALQPTDPTLDSVTSNGATTTNNVVVGSKFATGNNVVSGLDSLAIGGSGNTASGLNSEVIGSGNSTASGQGSTVVGGINNDNAGNWSATLGGLNQNVATGANRSAIVAGFGHNMNHFDSVILGGSNITTDSNNTVFVPSLNVGAGFKMPTGAADGYVLTSDASGVGTWGAASEVANVNYPYTTDISTTGVERTRNLTTIHFSSGFSYTGQPSSIYVGSNVTSIGNAAFGFSSLTSITISNSVTSIGNNAFVNCTGLTSITLPNSLISIDYDAFTLCSGLTSITIPNSVTSIGNSAFSNCTSLATINCLATTAPTLGSSAFSGVAATEIHVPVGATGYGTTYGGLTVRADL